MAEEKKDGTLWKWPSIVAMAALVGGLYLREAALHSPRPADTATLERISIGDQTVEARLWQDPFEAVHKYAKDQPGLGGKASGDSQKGDDQAQQRPAKGKKAAAKPKKAGAGGATNSTDASTNHAYGTVEELADQISRRAKSGSTNITVFLKLVPGGPYAEDIEVRLRARYAVLSGLGVGGFVPWDEEHLGYFQIPWPRGAALEHYTNGTVPTLSTMTEPAGRRILVPFEWFQRSNLYSPGKKDIRNRADNVLLIWLPAEDFDDHPCKRLAQLVHALDHAVNHHPTERGGTSNGSSPEATHTELPLTFKLFDPRLQHMLQEALDVWPPGPFIGPTFLGEISLRTELKSLEVYSAWSTTPEVLILPAGAKTNLVNQHISGEADSNKPSRPTNDLAFEGRRITQQILHERGPQFFNVTCTDSDLARALIDELKLRGVDLTKPSDGVVLLSEWDTFYGRALPLTFATEVRVRTARKNITPQCLLDVTNLTDKLQRANIRTPFLENVHDQLSMKMPELFGSDKTKQPSTANITNSLAEGLNWLIHQGSLPTSAEIDPNLPPHLDAVEQESARDKRVRLNRVRLSAAVGEELLLNCQWDEVARNLTRNRHQWPTNVYRATYFRGVDGLLPGESMPKPQPGKGKEKEGQFDEVARAFGRSQLDYIPRLARQLHDLDQEAEASGCTIKAIGVLGSDVYDKLLLLQALHDLFPKVIFFTTDLDARLCHPEELKTTRNLIVASSYDLGLSQRVREAIPPFRDSYQTAQFLATRIALATDRVSWLSNLQPQLFEIGRDGPHDLEPPRPPWVKSIRKDPLYAVRPSGWRGWGKSSSAFVGLVLALLLVGGHSVTLRDFFRPNRNRFAMEKVLYWLLGVCALLLMAALSLIIIYSHFHDGGEPFSVMAGISVWPTEILRLLAFVMSVLFLIKATFDIRRNDLILEEEFMLAPAGAAAVILPFRQRVRGFLKELFSWRQLTERPLVSSWAPPPGPKVNARDLWQQHKEFGRAPNRCRRYLMAAGCYGVFALLVTAAFGKPLSPYRGRLCFWTDLALLFLSMGAIFVLLFFVVDATLLCRRLVRFLSEYPTEYPPELLAKHAIHRGLDADNLDEVLDVQLIAHRTKVVGNLIYYPFIVLALIIVAHNSFFDHWQWPPSLLLIFGGLLACVFYGAVALRHEAAKARKLEVQRLKQKFVAKEAQGRKKAAERIQRLIDEINDTEEGAFAPLAQHPILRVLALPFGGAGLLTGLDFLALR